MIPAIVGSLVVRGIPAALQAGVDSGAYQVFGSIIKNTLTGKIVGHLQVTSLVTELAGGAASGPVGIVLKAIDIAQNEEIKSRLNEVARGVQALTKLTQLGVAIDIVGHGLTVAGIAVLMTQVESLRGEVRGVANRIDALDQKLDLVRQDATDHEFANLVAVARGYDEAWRLASGADQRWRNEAADALRLQLQFERRAAQAMQCGVEGYALADPLLDAVAFAGALRVSSLAACNEATAAVAAAVETARMLERIIGGLGRADLSHAILAKAVAEPGGPDWSLAQARARDETRAVAMKLRQREALALTRAACLPLLEARGLSPRQWLTLAREETEAPILTVTAD